MDESASIRTLLKTQYPGYTVLDVDFSEVQLVRDIAITQALTY